MKLDFSEAHFLDHSVLDPYCATLPGGRRRHLDYWWQFKGKESVHRQTFCRVGKHSTTHAWVRREGETGDQMHARCRTHEDWDRTLCRHCGKKL